MTLLREMKEICFPSPHAKGVIQDLEYAMRSKGALTPQEEKTLRVANVLPSGAFILGSALGTFVGWFGAGIGDKSLGLPPTSRFTRFWMATGLGFMAGRYYYNGTLHLCSEALLNIEGRIKMELANIILNKHSDDVYLVSVVKRHFFAEHLFDDLHQDQPLCRWHPRRSYIDSAFVERMKEIEANNSDDEARSVSTERNVNIRPFGGLMEDPLACILGSPGGNMESDNPSKHTSTILKRSELRARRRGHRCHHRHTDDKFAAF